MKKSLIFVGMISIGFAYAQKGNVGINSNKPKATLDIQPNADNARVDATTNQGILAPRLSKVRVANIETPVEGTLVYVTDETTSPISAYTAGTNTMVDNRVAKITEKGYYFYNGTEWVKTSAEANGELWAQRDNAGITETYLKPANDKIDFIGYTSGRRWGINLGSVVREDSKFVYPGSYGYSDGEVPVYAFMKSSVLPQNSTIGNPMSRTDARKNNYFFNQVASVVNEEHAGSGEAAGAKSYTAGMYRVDANNVTSNISMLTGFSSLAAANSNNQVGTLAGIRSTATVGNFQGAQATATTSYGGRFISTVYPGSKVTNLIGVSALPLNHLGTADYITGVEALLRTSTLHNLAQTSYTDVSIKDVRGVRTYIGHSEKATAETIFGVLATVDLLKGSKTTKMVYGMDSGGYIREGSINNDYIGYSSYLVGENNSTVNNVYGFKYHHALNASFSPTNMYGIYLEDVNKGANSNYAIYSNAGKVRVGDLAGAGDRVVYADENGVLKTGGSIASNNGVQNETSMTCTAENAGKINYTTIQQDGKDVGVFGFCMQKGTDYVWAYMLGGSNIYGTSDNGAAFGQGLQ